MRRNERRVESPKQGLAVARGMESVVEGQSQTDTARAYERERDRRDRERLILDCRFEGLTPNDIRKVTHIPPPLFTPPPLPPSLVLLLLLLPSNLRFLSSFLTSRSPFQIFSNSELILNCNRTFLADLTQRFSPWTATSCLGRYSPPGTYPSNHTHASHRPYHDCHSLALSLSRFRTTMSPNLALSRFASIFLVAFPFPPSTASLV